MIEAESIPDEFTLELHHDLEGKPDSATITGKTLLEPVTVGTGSLILLEDWTGDTEKEKLVILEVQRLEESKLGISVWGIQFTEDPTGLPRRSGRGKSREMLYVGQRCMPLSRMVLFRAGAQQATVRARGLSGRGAGMRQSRAAVGGDIFPGRCHHCGGRTGGTFQPGHDAKLKGELIREDTDEATAERILRRWIRAEDEGAAASPKVEKLVKRGDDFLRERVQARILERKEEE